ncbi:hypothetical protein KY285_030182 [Solanum tuberosum]|nr:hypothetical protein KY285_030182 [Solanum tuberosum]
MVLTADVISRILGIPNLGWCHYVKREWPSLDGLPSALAISRKFSNDPTLGVHCRVDKGAMQPLHKLLFYVVHKIILPRREKRTEVNYLDLTIMELLLSRHPINLPQLMLCHMHHICIKDQKLHGLGYGFWLGELFESLGIPVQAWQEQTTKDVIGDLNQVVVPALKRGANGPLQRLRSQLADKEKEIEALRVSYTATIDEMHLSFKAKEAELIAENENLKSELLQTRAALETAHLTNSAHLTGIFEMLRTHHTSMASPSSKQT